MNSRIIRLSDLSDTQIINLARLHHRAMHSLLTDLGPPFVERYYQIACADSSVVGVCALGADGNPLGWGMGSSKPDQLNRRLREAWGWFVIQMMRVLVTHPQLVLQLVASVRTASAPMKEGTIELTYIGVDSSARRQGLGGELLRGFVASTRERNFTAIELSVEADNADAIALYTRAGFVMLSSFTEGAFKRHRMRLNLP